MPYGGGGSVIAMPSTPWPKSLEIKAIRLAAANTNPFTGQQQIQDWGVNVQGISVSLPSLTQAAVAAWVTFLLALDGIVNVFQFPSAVVSAFPESLASGVYYRLKANSVSWIIVPGKIYKSLTFEARIAI